MDRSAGNASSCIDIPTVSTSILFTEDDQMMMCKRKTLLKLGHGRMMAGALP